MKNILKKQLAVVLAVLMIMTSWVFIAPSDNQAEALTAGRYYFRWYFKNTNGTMGMETSAVTLYPYVITDNGRGSKKQATDSSYSWSGSELGSGKSREYKGSTTQGFPIGVYGTIKNNNGTYGVNVNTDFWIQDANGNDVVKLWAISQSDWFSKKSSKNMQDYAGCDSGNLPYAASASIVSQPGNVTIPKSGTATTTFTATVKDQYGVQIGNGSLTRNATVSNTAGTTVACTSTSDANSDTFTISVTNAARLSGTTDTTTKKATVSYTFGGKTVTATTNNFTLTDPTYIYTMNGNGGTVTTPSTSTVSAYYGHTFGSTPAANRVGFDFRGMSTTKTDDSYAFTNPGDVSGKLTSSKVMGEDATYYAAWWAKNVKATFVDQNNQPIVNLTGKYGKTLAQYVNGGSVPGEIEYQKKAGETGTFNYVFDHWEIVDANKYNSGTSDTQVVDTATLGNGTGATLYGDVTFAPVFEPEQASYNVEFYNAAGTQISTRDYSYGATAVQPADPTMAADNTYTYTFKGWEEADAAQGAKIIDKGDATSAVTTVSKVKHDTIYIPVFEREFIDYTVTFKNSDPQFGDVTLTGHYGDVYEVPSHRDNYTKDGIRYIFEQWNLAAANGANTGVAADESEFGTFTKNVIYVADYSAEMAVYDIIFKDYDGTQLNAGSDKYEHGKAVVVPTATQTYRDDSYEYTFTGFADEDGNAVAALAGADKVYTAQYAKAALYTVTYMNGEEVLGTAKQIAGATIPAYTGENPTREDDAYAKNYVFSHFEDAEGNNIADVAMPAEDITVQAAFDADVTDYTVKFMSDDTVVSEQTLHYGDAVEVPENPTKPTDETYSYEFRGWDKNITAKCDGDATYNAVYRKAYVYYPVQWLNDDGTVVKTENYIYNERITAPDTTKMTSATMTPSSDDMTIVFDHWVYEDGTTYTRGDRIDGTHDSLTAVYVETGKDCTVTFKNEDGTVLKTTVVPYGKYLAEIDTPEAIKISDADKHYVFAGWNGIADESTERVLSDTVYTATYTSEAHTFALQEVTKAPTFTAEGSAIWACECEFAETRTVDVLTDTVAPSGYIYVRNNVWKDVADASFDVQTPVAGSNYIAITTSDTADNNDDYNPGGLIGSGVDTIDYTIWAEGGYQDPATLPESAWTSAWSYAEQYAKAKALYTADAEGNLSAKDQAALDAKMAKLQANANTTLEQIVPASFEDGQDFVIVCRITDKMGNTMYANTGVLVYDNTAPEVEVTSDCNDGNVKHCLDVTIKASDAGDIESVKVDGETIEAASYGVYNYNKAGLHQVVVTDTAGNNTKVNFEIVGKHNTKVISQAPTCTEIGFTKEVCTLCGTVVKDTEEVSPSGHNEAKKTTPATCTEDAVETTYCTVCLETLEVKTIEGSALSHDWVEYYKKNADCTNKGTLEEICSRCNEKRVTELDIDDTVHTWYPAVTVKATCIAEGYKTRTCKYCGTVETIETYDKTEHVPGEWIVQKEATCTEDGLKVAYCANNCKTTDIIAQEVIPATGHSLKATVVAPTVDAEGYTLYECKNCDFTEKKDYTPKLVEYTISFDVDGTVTDVVLAEGETLTANDAAIPEAVKAADNTYTYTFTGWADAEGNIVEFPITAEADMTLTATFKEKYINYAVELLNEDGTSYYKIGYNHFGDTVDLSTYKLSKAADEINTYEFAGWKVSGADDSTAAMSVVIDTTDKIVLVPVFKPVAQEYTVVFAYDYDNVIATYKNVPATTSVTFDKAEPTKAYDDGQHYIFAGWDKADENGTVANVTSDVLVIAQFTAENHSTANGIVKSAATCLDPEITEYTCSCGYSFTRESAPALGHDWSEEATVVDGVLGFVCDRCGEFKEDTTTYTIKFIDEDQKTVLKTIAYQKWGAEITVPSDPVKKDTASETFTFAGWTDAEGNPVEVATTVTKNATYYASYTAHVKMFTVVYAVDHSNVCASYKVKGGDSVEYTGKTPVNYNANDYGHMEFVEWSQGGVTGAIDNVQSDLYILAKFERTEHNYTKKSVEPTCTTPGGMEFKCSVCGYSYIQRTAPATGHTWVLVKEEKNVGYYTCSTCGETKTEEIPDTSVIADIAVVDSEGNPVNGAKVTLLDGNTVINSGVTGADGHVKLKVPEAKKYTVVVEYGDQTSSGTVTVNGDGSTSVSGVKIEPHSCSCACHKDGLWGNIFRFFHTIIHWITGKFNCCNDPDARYKK